jgi:hypothetical protein
MYLLSMFDWRAQTFAANIHYHDTIYLEKTNRTLTGEFVKITTSQKYTVICLYDSNTLQRIKI